MRVSRKYDTNSQSLTTRQSDSVTKKWAVTVTVWQLDQNGRSHSSPGLCPDYPHGDPHMHNIWSKPQSCSILTLYCHKRRYRIRQQAALLRVHHRHRQNEGNGDEGTKDCGMESQNTRIWCQQILDREANLPTRNVDSTIHSQQNFIVTHSVTHAPISLTITQNDPSLG